VDAQGRVTATLGAPGEAGHQNGSGHQVRFNRPTFLTLSTPLGGPSRLLVADSGNHVIRAVDSAGRVSTFAGNPGHGGAVDADDPAQATFREPAGLAVDDALGCVYVADRGNNLIRKINPEGQVTTLAGGADPAQAPQDGIGHGASFKDLRGLALRRGPDGGARLYVLDGNSLRSISLLGKVKTVAGHPVRPGFQASFGGAAAELAKLPCFNDPWGLVAVEHVLYVADCGNNAVQGLVIERKEAATWVVAGDPQEGGLRYGLLRDGHPGPLDPRWAALAGPTGLCRSAARKEELLVASGSALACLGNLIPYVNPNAGPDLEVLERGGGTQAGVPFQVSFLATSPEAEPLPKGHHRPVYFSVTCINPDGSIAHTVRGEGHEGRLIQAEGLFGEPGAGRLRVSIMTVDGYGTWVDSDCQVDSAMLGRPRSAAITEAPEAVERKER
jgi:hypothetical protein